MLILQAQVQWEMHSLAGGQDQYRWMMCHVLGLRQHYCSVATLHHITVVTMKMLVSDVYPVNEKIHSLK